MDSAYSTILGHYGILGTAKPHPGERDRSFRITPRSGEFMLERNIADHAEALEGQAAAIGWALANVPDLALASVIHTTSGSLVGVNCSDPCGARVPYNHLVLEMTNKGFSDQDKAKTWS